MIPPAMCNTKPSSHKIRRTATMARSMRDVSLSFSAPLHERRNQRAYQERILRTLSDTHACGTARPFLPETPDFASQRTKPMLRPVDGDGSVSRTTLDVERSTRLTNPEPGHGGSACPAQPIEIMKGDL